jgi:hypothetical protein
VNENLKNIDVDLTIPPEGKGKGLIELPEDELETFASSMPTFEAAVGPGIMVPPSKYKELSLKRMATKQQRNDVTKIYNQGSFGSCTGFAAAQVVETTRRRRFGLQYWVSLSGLSVYMQIPGVTENSGATIKAAMAAACNVGPLPTNTPVNTANYQHTHPLRTWQRLPPGFEPTANMFRGGQFVVARGRDEIFSAMLNDFCGMVGRQGHAVPYVDAAWSERYGELLVPFANSYDQDWGDEGFGYDSRRIVDSMICYVLINTAVSPDLPIPNLDA